MYYGKLRFIDMEEFIITIYFLIITLVYNTINQFLNVLRML